VVALEDDIANEEVPCNEPVKDKAHTLPFTVNDADVGVVVPIPTFPLKAVVTIDVLPSTTVFEPRPIALSPITIWFI
jgi:hypothetical protein